jgi:glucose/mannose-6-phosphate isomerase
MSLKTKPLIDDVNEIRRLDKSNMLQFCIDASEHFRTAVRISKKMSVGFSEPNNIIIAGVGGSGIGGELLKDCTRNQAQVSIETSKDYTLPAYANQKTLVIVVSYSGDTEESLSAFNQAMNKKCMIYCISSGGTLIEYAEKLNVPFLRIPSGMPPRAASPYLFIPQLQLLEKLSLIPDISNAFRETSKILTTVSCQNAPQRTLESNPAKSLASGINGTVPVTYGFGIYRAVAQRWKQQFNENSKVPAKWGFFPELNHNEIVGWEKIPMLARHFSFVFIRDIEEPAEVSSRIETTKALMPSVSKKFEVQAQGKAMLPKMLSIMLLGDFTSIYLALMRKVDPTPVQTIAALKQRLGETGTKERIIHELDQLKPVKS